MEVASAESVDVRLDGAIGALRGGGMVLLTDGVGVDRTGYLVAAARTIGAETVASMLRDAVGVPWLALSAERCAALGLSRIAGREYADGREMMVTIEARDGISTGISAADRARTMRVAADPASTAADVSKPGHVLPVRVRTGSAMRRWGVAEAAVELVTLAGLPGGATLCQVMSDDGQVAGGADLRLFGDRLGLQPIGTLDVLERRLHATRLIERLGGERMVSTCAGPMRAVSYRDLDCGQRHYALLFGEVAQPAPLRVFARTQDPVEDVFAIGNDSSCASLDRSLRAIAAAGRGALLYLAPTPGAPGSDAAAAPTPASTAGRVAPSLDAVKPQAAIRRAHLVRQILRDLGVSAVLAHGFAQPLAATTGTQT